MLSGLSLVITRHAMDVIESKGFDLGEVKRTFHRYDEITRVAKYPGQIRLIGRGLALVGKVRDNQFILITVYQDQVITPPREDQLDTPEGRRYAQRYALGLGRG